MDYQGGEEKKPQSLSGQIPQEAFTPATGKQNEQNTFATRGEIFHQMLMEDFRFMEAARMQSGEYENASLSTDDLKPISKVRTLILTNPQGLINFATYTNASTTVENETAVSLDVRSRRFMTKMARWPPYDIWAHWILSSKFFGWFMIGVIFCNSIMIAIEGEIDDSVESQPYKQVIDAFDFFFLTMYIVEIALKLTDSFHNFWRDAWNWFDLLVTLMSLVGPILDLILDIDDDDHVSGFVETVKYIRIMRIFRALNVVTRIKKIMVIWEAITRTFVSLFFITLLMLIFFYIFAIIGIQLFDRYTRSHKTLAELEYHFAFENLPMAMVTLFLLFTLDRWSYVLHSLAIEVGYIISLLYVLSWILLGSFIFTNIFVGVMVNNFQNIRKELLQQTEELTSTATIASDLDIFGLSETMDEHNDPDVDWETKVFHNLEIIRTCSEEVHPTLWPRDTLFQYYIILEALANNIDERERIFSLLNQALLRHFEDA